MAWGCGLVSGVGWCFLGGISSPPLQEQSTLTAKIHNFSTHKPSFNVFTPGACEIPILHH